MPERTFYCHGVTFYRRGECKRCGECEDKPEPCKHFYFKDGLATCDTYGKGDYIEKNCEEFPNNPFCRVVREGICGFTFEPISDEEERKYKERLSNMVNS
jgi:hypothetical protein